MASLRGDQCKADNAGNRSCPNRKALSAKDSRSKELATHNIDDFTDTGVNIANPWMLR